MLPQDRRPQRPVITSLTSANASFDRWLSLNYHTRLPDASGQLWTIDPRTHILPDPVNLHAAIHRLSFALHTEISQKTLLEQGVFDASKDQRLLSLMDHNTITVLYQRPPFETTSIEKLRTQAAEDLIKIREALRIVDLRDRYRSAVGRWVDRRFHMAYPPIPSYLIKIDLEF